MTSKLRYGIRSIPIRQLARPGGSIWTIVYSFTVTTLIALALKATIGLRVDEETEVNGLDLAEHAETAYHGTN